MKRLSRGLIFLLLATLIAASPFLAGYFHLSKAVSARDSQTASAEYEAAAHLLFWRSDLDEKAGLAALESQDAPRAITLFERARSQNSLSSLGQARLGQAYLSTGAETKAIAEWQALANDKTAPVEIFPGLAALHHRRGEIVLEAAALRQWLKLEPGNADANERLGRLLAAFAAPEALPFLETAAAADPAAANRLEKLISALKTPAADPAYRLALCGQALAHLGEWHLAEQTFARAVDANPSYASAWAWLGLARQANQTAGAQAALEYALKLDGNSAPLRAMLGTFWLRANQPQKARAEFERATQLEPANPAWWLGLGGAAAQIDLPAALAAYVQAANLAPEDAENWSALALFCVENNAYLEDYGLEAALRAFALDPENPASLDLLGRAQMGLGQAAAAETLFKKALAAGAAGQTAPYHLHLGLLYLQTERTAQARAEFEQTLQLDPQGASGLQAKNLLKRYFP
jgi:tetratricopeptide (TPR) repeat protein